MRRTFIIAELATTWRYDGDAVPLADSIKRIAEAGADAVKLQFCSRPDEMAERRAMPDGTYEYLHYDVGHLRYATDYAKLHRLEFMCTVFIPCDVAYVAPLVSRYKVASLEAMSYDLKDAYSALAPEKPLYVSTGAMTEQQVFMCRNHWSNYLNAYFLHCASLYPQPMATLNLTAIQNYGFIGLSDHTPSILAGAFAVCAGAEVLEKHVRADGCPTENPDFPHSLTLEDFGRYVYAVRQAEQALSGTGDKVLYKNELPLLPHRVTQ